MSKDPAFLFYPNDWLGGTMGMTFEQKGAYMELLMMQFNQGQFTEAQAKQVLSICFDVAWATVKQKFLTDGTYYWNRRLREEIEKRKRFTESRRLNGLAEKKPEASAKHMPKHMEDENKNENIDGIKLPFSSVEFSEKWNEYTKFRSENRYPKFKPTGLKNHFLRLMKLCEGNEQTAIAIYDEAMANNYQGIFPLKEAKNGANKKPGQSSAVQFKIDDHGQPTRELINEYIQSRNREKNNASLP